MIESTKNFEMAAKTFSGLEVVLAEELKELGAKDIVTGKRAVSFSGDTRLMYEANLWLRTAICILKPFYHFKATDEKSLYDKVRQFRWSDILNNTDTLAITSAVNSPYFNHSKYVALKVKDAIADQFRDETGMRPSVDTFKPTVKINVHIQNERCTLSLDSSGEPLFKRGYRSENEKAPLNEVLAAGMIKLSGWDRKSDFLDRSEERRVGKECRSRWSPYP